MHPIQYWAIVPAAGVGARMGGGLPKQYLPLRGKTVIEHSLARLYHHPDIAGVIVAISADDHHGKALLERFPTSAKPFSIITGGAERAHSVLNALHRLAEHAATHDWVLVHDAVRPCLRRADIDALIKQVTQHGAGGLLGVRVHDTVKKINAAGEVVATLNRNELWRAQTPQMFRLGPLTQALAHAINENTSVTDEAAAMALMGIAPLMVEGHADNIKITRKPDVALAEFYLAQQEINP